MNKNVKISLALVVVAVAAILGFGALAGGDEPEEPETDAERAELLVRADSPRLTEGPNATFVEFPSSSTEFVKSLTCTAASTSPKS